MTSANTMDSDGQNTNAQEELSPSDIVIGISSCLLGEKVRFDTGHKHNSYITQTLGKYFRFHSFCPEMAIGLGTPRETLRLVQTDDGIRCVGTRTDTLDVTRQLIEVAEAQKPWWQNLCGYILKKDSPSCGMERVKVYKNAMPEKSGVGLYADVLQSEFPSLPVEEEGRLGDPVLRENFIKRVFAFRHWRDLLEEGLSMHKLTDFHARYKYVLLSHHQERTRALGKRLADAASEPMDEVADWYFAEFMAILKLRATRKNHVNVLQHLQGFLKEDIDKEDKKELSETIEDYRQELLPLIVPVVLLRHHFRRHPKPFVERSKYLQPHPSELMLLNSL
ncbi:MAG: DUF523 and DUF1722 domain-containing protein [Ketobacteraceae bacterium]|nr:DUF523 and DUF1722 domain-containing protein [Ketobacteraceae bacterium]